MFQAVLFYSYSVYLCYWMQQFIKVHFWFVCSQFISYIFGYSTKWVISELSTASFTTYKCSSVTNYGWKLLWSKKWNNFWILIAAWYLRYPKTTFWCSHPEVDILPELSSHWCEVNCYCLSRYPIWVACWRRGYQWWRHQTWHAGLLWWKLPLVFMKTNFTCSCYF